MASVLQLPMSCVSLSITFVGFISSMLHSSIMYYTRYTHCKTYVNFLTKSSSIDIDPC